TRDKSSTRTPDSDCWALGWVGVVMRQLLTSQHNPGMTSSKISSVLAVLVSLAACTPTLNWREIQPEGSELFAMFPCKPERLVRSVTLAGDKVEMRMSYCVVKGVTYAVA